MFLHGSVKIWFGKHITVGWKGTFALRRQWWSCRSIFYWPKIQQDIDLSIRFYTTCAIAKPTIKKQGLYIPLPTPNGPWESISMDYMSRLFSTKHGNDCVFVVIDLLSKMAILIACKKSISTEATAKLFFEHAWVHFGLPQTIISDWDNMFLSTF